MDVKSAFLNGELEDEVYIKQPEGFLLPEKEDYVCRLKKALYGLKQAPRAWYDCLDGYLHQQGFKKVTANSNLYIQIDKDNFTIIEVYVDDIIFGSNDDRLSNNFATNMQSEFQMSLLGCIDDRKSISGATFYLGGCLISWLRKKKTLISLFTAEVEYIAVAACCIQFLWMKKNCQDLQVKFDEPIPIFCDNTNAISISKNLVMHSKTKHIPIKYHFIREHVAENNIKLEYVGTKENIIDSFTKHLPCEAFEYLRQKLGILPSSH
eukprot:PITA_20162